MAMSPNLHQMVMDTRRERWPWAATGDESPAGGYHQWERE